MPEFTTITKACPLCGAGWVKCDECRSRTFSGDSLTCPTDGGVLACIGCDSAVVTGEDVGEDTAVVRNGVVYPWTKRRLR